MGNVLEELYVYLPNSVIDALMRMPLESPLIISEIRLRLGRASSVTIGSKNCILRDHTGGVLRLEETEMQFCFSKVCENSVYKYENEIKNGYITLHNGCRVGFCGTRTESGFLKYISSINIRISRTVQGASHEIYPHIYKDGVVFSSFIVSLPCGGKTTILTDIAFRLSCDGIRVAIVDERGEIAAVHRGRAIKEVGDLTDVLDNYPKGDGMMIALRSLSPQVLICDEIGSKSDVEAMMQALNAGVPVIASVHGDDPVRLAARPQLRYLLDNGAISKFFFLEGAHRPGKLKCTLSIEEFYEIIRTDSDDC